MEEPQPIPPATQPQPVVKPEKRILPGAFYDGRVSEWVRTIILMAVAGVIGYSIAFQTILSTSGTIVIAWIVLFGIIVGGGLSWLLKRTHLAWLQRKLLSQNVGQLKIFTATGAPMSFIRNYSDETTECNGNRYTIQDPNVRPVIEDWIPTLYYRQGVTSPLPWDEVSKRFSDRRFDAIAEEGAIVKLGSLLEGGGILKVSKRLQQYQLFCLIGIAIEIVILLYLAYTLDGMNKGIQAVWSQNQQILVYIGNLTARGG